LAEIVESLTRAIVAIHKGEVPCLDYVLPALTKLTQFQAVLPVHKNQRFFEQLVALSKFGREPGEIAAATQERFNISSSTFY